MVSRRYYSYMGLAVFYIMARVNLANPYGKFIAPILSKRFKGRLAQRVFDLYICLGGLVVGLRDV